MNISIVSSGLEHIIMGAERLFFQLIKGLRRKKDVKLTVYGGGELQINGIEHIQLPILKREFFHPTPKFPTLLPINTADYFEASTFSLILTPKLLNKKC